jgi:hypothetical protein
MRNTRVWMTLGFCLTPALLAGAQSGKAGLWAVASRTTFQQSGTVGVMNAPQPLDPPSDANPGLAVCLSQEVVDKFGVILPPSLRDCEYSHIVRQPNHLTADVACTGRMNGRGSVDASWTDDDHVIGKIHFVVKAKHGPEKTMTMAWTQDSNAVYKGSDCGQIKPRVLPPKEAQASAVPYGLRPAAPRLAAQPAPQPAAQPEAKQP